MAFGQGIEVVPEEPSGIPGQEAGLEQLLRLHVTPDQDEWEPVHPSIAQPHFSRAAFSEACMATSG